MTAPYTTLARQIRTETQESVSQAAIRLNGGVEGNSRPLDAIAGDLADEMAEAVFAPVDGLCADWDTHCRKHGLCGR